MAVFLLSFQHLSLRCVSMTRAAAGSSCWATLPPVFVVRSRHSDGRVFQSRSVVSSAPSPSVRLNWTSLSRLSDTWSLFGGMRATDFCLFLCVLLIEALYWFMLMAPGLDSPCDSAWSRHVAASLNCVTHFWSPPPSSAHRVHRACRWKTSSISPEDVESHAFSSRSQSSVSMAQSDRSVFPCQDGGGGDSKGRGWGCFFFFSLQLLDGANELLLLMLKTFH